MRVIVVTHPTPKDVRKIFKFEDTDYIIGVDQAILSMYKQRIKIDLAVGDFDSLKNPGILTQLNKVELSPIKDVTDTYQALIEAKKLNADELIMIGGIGGQRIEHYMANLSLFNEFENLVIIDDYSVINRVNVSLNHIPFYDGYVSFFGYPKAIISLKHFKYELDHYHMGQFDPIGISNETLEHAILEVHEGSVLMIKTIKD